MGTRVSPLLWMGGGALLPRFFKFFQYGVESVRDRDPDRYKISEAHQMSSPIGVLFLVVEISEIYPGLVYFSSPR